MDFEDRSFVDPPKACCSEDVEPKRSSYLCDTGGLGKVHDHNKQMGIYYNKHHKQMEIYKVTFGIVENLYLFIIVYYIR